MIGNLLSDIQNYQCQPISLLEEEDPIVNNYLRNLVKMDDEALYQVAKKFK